MEWVTWTWVIARCRSPILTLLQTHSWYAYIFACHRTIRYWPRRTLLKQNWINTCMYTYAFYIFRGLMGFYSPLNLPEIGLSAAFFISTQMLFWNLFLLHCLSMLLCFIKYVEFPCYWNVLYKYTKSAITLKFFNCFRKLCAASIQHPKAFLWLYFIYTFVIVFYQSYNSFQIQNCPWMKSIKWSTKISKGRLKVKV